MRYLLLASLIMLTACGKDGTNGINGQAGTPGVNGKDGLNGTDGEGGQDATPVTMIKFCPNEREVYPSNFPEYGMCIDNNLYAVYWNGNAAFLAKLLPGRYTTTAIGGNCTFTVKSDSCKVL